MPQLPTQLHISFIRPITKLTLIGFAQIAPRVVLVGLIRDVEIVSLAEDGTAFCVVDYCFVGLRCDYIIKFDRIVLYSEEERR